MFLSGLHEIAVPDLVAQVWRGGYFLAAVWVLGQMLEFMRWPNVPTSRRWFMAALSLAILRTIAVNILRWDGPLYWEGLPVDTLVLALTWCGLRHWQREPGGPLAVRPGP